MKYILKPIYAGCFLNWYPLKMAESRYFFAKIHAKACETVFSWYGIVEYILLNCMIRHGRDFDLVLATNIHLLKICASVHNTGCV